VSDRKAFLLRIDPDVLAAAQRWADDDLRSLNGQIEWVLRRALDERGRLKESDAASLVPASTPLAGAATPDDPLIDPRVIEDDD